METVAVCVDMEQHVDQWQDEQVDQINSFHEFLSLYILPCSLFKTEITQFYFRQSMDSLS